MYVPVTLYELTAKRRIIPNFRTCEYVKEFPNWRQAQKSSTGTAGGELPEPDEGRPGGQEVEWIAQEHRLDVRDHLNLEGETHLKNSSTH